MFFGVTIFWRGMFRRGVSDMKVGAGINRSLWQRTRELGVPSSPQRGRMKSEIVWMTMPTPTPRSGTPCPNGADYLVWVRQQDQDKRACWGKDMSHLVLEDKLLRSTADYKRRRRGHELCLPHMPEELAEAWRSNRDAENSAHQLALSLQKAAALHCLQSSSHTCFPQRVWTRIKRDHIETSHALDNPLLPGKIEQAAAFLICIDNELIGLDFKARLLPRELFLMDTLVERHAPYHTKWMNVRKPSLSTMPQRAVLVQAMGHPGAISS